MRLLVFCDSPELLFNIGFCAEQLQLETYKATSLDECHNLVTTITFDIFIVDRSIIGLGKFSIEDHIKRLGYNCPVLVFNDNKNDTLLEYWLSKFNSPEYEIYIRAFEEAIMCHPADLINSYTTSNKNKNITGRCRIIFSALVQKANAALSLDEIMLFLQKDNLHIKKDVLYTYVSKLRTICSMCSKNINIKMLNKCYIFSISGLFKNEETHNTII